MPLYKELQYNFKTKMLISFCMLRELLEVKFENKKNAMQTHPWMSNEDWLSEPKNQRPVCIFHVPFSETLIWWIDNAYDESSYHFIKRKTVFC